MEKTGMRPLGASGIQVSRLSLGSWKTYERVPRDVGVAVMRKAQEVGINFLDDARYNDETGQAPLKSGYSEVVFGELFRAADWRRDEVVVANKLWWEFWPEQSAEAELDGSLGRMGLDHIDLAYAERPPKGLDPGEIVRQMGALVKKGKLRAWGVLNWRADLIADAGRAAIEQGVPAPCAAQLAYNLAHRSPVEDADMSEAFRACGASVVASFVMEGGALTGKYADPAATGRWSGLLTESRLQPALSAGVELRALAERSGTTPAAMAIAFALSNPDVASVLFGATNPAQVVENAGALELLDTMSEETVAALNRIGA